MTTNQTIDGVPRELRSLIERVTSQELGMSAKKDRAEAAHELRALLDAPAVPAQLSVPEECPHLIVFDDTEREQLMFSGAGAREAALKTWEKISASWNAHLFVRVGRNSRDDRYPSAGHKPTPQPQGEPVAHLLLGETFYGTGGPEIGDFDIQYDHEACERLAKAFPGQQIALYAEQPAPVAVVKLGTHHVLGAIHNVEGFPGVTGFQIKTLTDLLNSVITGK